MKLALILCMMTVGVMAAPQSRFVPVLQRTEVHDDFGQYSLGYQSADGTIVSEQGAFTPTRDGKNLVFVKQGEYSYYAPNGQLIRTSYIADDFGFRAAGDHIPKSNH